MLTWRGLARGVCFCLPMFGLAWSLPSPEVIVYDDLLQVTMLFPSPEIDHQGELALFKVGDLPLEAEAPGQPLLPVADLQILLPPGREVARLEVQGVFLEQPFGGQPAWDRGFRHLCDDGEEFAEADPDPGVFESSALHPGQPAALLGGGSFRGYRLASIRLWPLQVSPAAGTLRAWSRITVRVHLVEASRGERSRLRRGLDRDVTELARFVANPETAWSYGATRGEKTRAAEEMWLVICPERLRSAFERLVHHRQIAGVSAGLRTTEEILGSGDDTDDAAKIREAIREAYENRGTTFVLLGGDDVDDEGQSLIPVRHCPGYDNMPSDWYFGALDEGLWDADEDGTICEDNEVDWYTEVHIGRAMVDTLEEANRWIDKLLLYEKGVPEERRAQLVFMGEKLDDSSFGDDAMEQTASLIPEEYRIEKLYARPETYNKVNVVDNLNRSPNMSNHLGHSGASGVMSLGRSDVQNLANETPFFSYSQGCYAGAFDQEVAGNDEAISEHFLFAEHAAFGVIMNGRYGWYCIGNPTCLSQELDHEFWDAIFSEGFGTLGEANSDSRHDKAGSAQGNHTMAYCFLETNLHGDPATVLDLDSSSVIWRLSRVDDQETGNGNGVVDPGETIRLFLTLANEGGTTAAGIEAKLSSSSSAVTIHDDWAMWQELAPGESRENDSPAFSVTVDADCGETVGFRLDVVHDGGQHNISVFSLLVGEIHDDPVFTHDFEESEGWESGGDAHDGSFVRADPHGVTDAFAGPTQPEDDHSEGDGSLCWVTGNPSASSGHDPHTGEVDRGTAWIASPGFDGTGAGELTLRFARWLHRTGVAALNGAWYRALASNDDGASWTEVERLDMSVPFWEIREIDLADYLEPTTTMKIRFEAEESIRMPGDPLLELLVDDVTVLHRVAECLPWNPVAEKAPGEVASTLMVEKQEFAILLQWGTPPVDEDHDAARDYPVWRSTDPEGGFQMQASPMGLAWRDWDAMGDLRPLFLCWLVSAENDGGGSGEEPAP